MPSKKRRVDGPVDPFQLLTSVAVVCGKYPYVLALEHAAKTIDGFVGYCHRWKLPKAVKSRNLRLIRRVVSAFNEQCATTDDEDLPWQYKEATALAAVMGDLSLLQNLRGWTSIPFDAGLGVAAALSGNLQMLRWIKEKTPELLHGLPGMWVEQVAFDVAAERGCFETVQWLVKTFPDSAWTLGPAACGGHLELVKWLHQHANLSINQLPDPPEMMERLSFYHYCQYFEESSQTNEKAPVAAQLRFSNPVLHGELQPATDAMDWAARNGHFDVMKWLFVNRGENCSPEAINSAAEAGNMEMLLWLDEHFDSQWENSAAMDHAARRGHVEVLKWLQDHHSEGCSTNAMDWAARKGYLDAVKWLHENRQEGCTTDAMNHAAKKGYLEVVQWLHVNRSEGCTTRAMDLAAAYGHLEVVQWLHFNRNEGCTTTAVNLAAGYGALEVVKWLLANRPERGTSNAYSFANAWGQREVLSWFREQQIRFPYES